AFGGTFPNASLVTPIAEAVAKKAHSIWVGFAKNPEKGPGWPRSSPHNGTLALLGVAGNDTDIVLDHAGTYNGICQNVRFPLFV
ncbi:hypothetical protein FB451DRAFT_1424033, partial [Mycena latifolia]